MASFHHGYYAYRHVHSQDVGDKAGEEHHEADPGSYRNNCEAQVIKHSKITTKFPSGHQNWNGDQEGSRVVKTVVETKESFRGFTILCIYKNKIKNVDIFLRFLQHVKLPQS